MLLMLTSGACGTVVPVDVAVVAVVASQDEQHEEKLYLDIFVARMVPSLVGTPSE